MSLTFNSWDYLGAFLAVMQEGSFSAAARKLNVTQPTIRRQIESLEALVFEALFTRSRTGLTPTSAAHRMLPYAEAMAANAKAMVRAISGADSEISGTVRLSCSPVIGAEVLPLVIKPLLQAHPELELEVSSTDKVEDLLRRDVDVAIRMVRPTQNALVALKLGLIKVGLFASQSYLAERGTPTTLKMLTENHCLIGEDRDRTMAAFFRQFDLGDRSIRFTYRTDDSLAQLAAIRSGIGIGVCQVGIGSRDKDLMRLLPDVEVSLEAWLIMHEDLRSVRRIRVVYDHLVAEMRTYARTGALGLQNPLPQQEKYEQM